MRCLSNVSGFFKKGPAGREPGGCCVEASSSSKAALVGLPTSLPAVMAPSPLPAVMAPAPLPAVVAPEPLTIMRRPARDDTPSRDFPEEHESDRAAQAKGKEAE